MFINATLCYVQQNSQTLMLRRCKKNNDIHFGKWNGLGGKFEPGESPEECAVREIKEESGLDVNRLEMKGIITFPDFDAKNDWLVFLFTANTSSGKLIDSPEGDLAWIDNDSILNLPLWEGDRLFIPWLKNPGFFSAKFVYKQGKLLNHSVVFY
jgi:8-oxo-dGTP diphosphatase